MISLIHTHTHANHSSTSSHSLVSMNPSQAEDHHSSNSQEAVIQPEGINFFKIRCPTHEYSGQGAAHATYWQQETTFLRVKVPRLTQIGKKHENDEESWKRRDACSPVNLLTTPGGGFVTGANKEITKNIQVEGLLGIHRLLHPNNRVQAPSITTL